MNDYSSAKDFRWRAREALKGSWLMVVLTTLVASIFGASVGVGNGTVSPIELISRITPYANQDVNINYQFDNGNLDPVSDQMVTAFAGVFAIVIILGLIFVIIAKKSVTGHFFGE